MNSIELSNDFRSQMRSGEDCRMDVLSANRCRCFRGLKGKGNALSERVVILGGDAGNI